MLIQPEQSSQFTKFFGIDLPDEKDPNAIHVSGPISGCITLSTADYEIGSLKIPNDGYHSDLDKEIKALFIKVQKHQMENDKLFTPSDVLAKLVSLLKKSSSLSLKQQKKIKAIFRTKVTKESYLKKYIKFVEATKFSSLALNLANFYNGFQWSYLNYDQNPSLYWIVQAKSYLGTKLLGDLVDLPALLKNIPEIDCISFFEHDELVQTALDHSTVTSIALFKESSFANHAETIGYFIKNSSSIQKITLKSRREAKTEDLLNPLTIAPISEALKINSTITSLTIENSDLGDKGALKVIKALKQNKNVSHLNLNSCKLTDEIAMHLIHLIEKNQKLVRLELLGNDINETNWMKIQDALKKK